MSQNNFNIRLKDVNSINRDFGVPQNFRTELSKVVRANIMYEMEREITRMASSELRSSREEYLNGLEVTSKSISLTGWLPNAVESGAGAFDMKDGFSKSGKVKLKKDGGWYMTIPFRIYTPGAGDSRTRMTWQIYRAVKRDKSYNAGTTSSRPKFVDPTTNAVYQAYQHKSPILQGIKKNTTDSGTTYHTFRRVSDKSDPNSWIHRGMQAHNFIDRAWNNINLVDIFESVINEYL